MRFGFWLPLFLSLSALGCATAPVRSHPIAQSQRGVPYSLPATAVHVTLTVAPPVKPKGPRKVSLAAVAVPIPDARHQYVLEHVDHLLYSDDVKFGVATNGLISSATVNTTDKTPEVFEGLVTIAASVTEILAATPGGALGVDGDPDEDLKAIEGRHEFLVPLRLGRGQKLVLPGKPESLVLELSVESLHGGARLARRPAGRPGGGSAGVYVRLPRPYSVTASLYYGAQERYLVTSAGVLNAPDFSPIVTVPVERAALVAAQNTLSFEGGALTSAHYVRPSPANSFVTSIGDAVGSVVGLPTKLVQARFNMDTEAAKLLELEQKAEDDARARQEAERDRRRALATAASDAEFDAERAWLEWDAARTTDPHGVETRRLRHALELSRMRANQLARDAGQRRPYP